MGIQDNRCLEEQLSTKIMAGDEFNHKPSKLILIVEGKDDYECFIRYQALKDKSWEKIQDVLYPIDVKTENSDKKCKYIGKQGLINLFEDYREKIPNMKILIDRDSESLIEGFIEGIHYYASNELENHLFEGELIYKLLLNVFKELPTKPAKDVILELESQLINQFEIMVHHTNLRIFRDYTFYKTRNDFKVKCINEAILDFEKAIKRTIATSGTIEKCKDAVFQEYREILSKYNISLNEITEVVTEVLGDKSEVYSLEELKKYLYHYASGEVMIDIFSMILADPSILNLSKETFETRLPLKERIFKYIIPKYSESYNQVIEEIFELAE